eukprot:TRINITY_DN1872_c1_g1_i1.p1 TRINITY_DN1872_c1_g1~~TRINITY_DN1872_c1_g1_i1.p1  ORF type:complete len:264 (+),score=50.28 TRINITY_DN1872_c1_g1_i1:44-835(+)
MESTQSTLTPTSQYKLAVIGGTSLLESSYMAGLEVRTVHTVHGDVVLHFAKDFIFVQRHQADPDKTYTQPHLVNHRAIVTALHQCGVQRTISFSSVGSLRKNATPGTLVIPDDFFDIWHIITLFDDARSHGTPTIDKELRAQVVKAIQTGLPQVPLVDGGTYVQTMGPRFETPAEIKVLAMFGDVVAMTAASEVILHSEVKIPIAVVNMIDNMANGLADKPIEYAEFKAGVRRNERTVEQVLGVLLNHFLGIPIREAGPVSSD